MKLSPKVYLIVIGLLISSLTFSSLLLNTKINDREETIDYLLLVNDSLELENQILKEKILELETNITRYKERIKELEGEVERIGGTAKSYQNELRKLNKKLEEVETEKRQIIEKYLASKNDIGEKSALIYSTEKKLGDSQKKLNELYKEIAELEKTIETLKRKKSEQPSRKQLLEEALINTKYYFSFGSKISDFNGKPVRKLRNRVKSNWHSFEFRIKFIHPIHSKYLEGKDFIAQIIDMDKGKPLPFNEGKKGRIGSTFKVIQVKNGVGKIKFVNHEPKQSNNYALKISYLPNPRNIKSKLSLGTSSIEFIKNRRVKIPIGTIE